MPSLAPRLCRCGKITPAGSQCPCAAKRDRQRPSARKRGYDTAWQREARAFLALPGNERCECGAPATLVRHKISIAKRPDLRMVRSNWMPGCVRCNAIDAAKDRR